MPRVFLITGSSTGLGREYAQEVLDQGDCVVATARKPETLSFQGTHDKNYLACKLDVSNKADIKETFDQALKKFGRIDVVCNNAGYGLAGCFEELDDEQIRQQMEINFFGLIDVTRAALEIMRNRQSPMGGTIQQVTSVAAHRGFPFFSIYCASKFAVEGLTESLRKELKPEWNIHLTCIEPGGFRTDWAGRSMVFADRHPAYDHLNPKGFMTKRHGTQMGDPKKGGKAMYQFAVMEKPPLRSVIGSDAYNAVLEELHAYEENYKQYEKIAKSTDVEE